MDDASDTSDFSQEELDALDCLMNEYVTQEDDLDLLKENLLSHTLIAYIEEQIANEKNTKIIIISFVFCNGVCFFVQKV